MLVLQLIIHSLICLAAVERNTATHSLDLEAEFDQLFERKYAEISKKFEEKEKEFEEKERIYEEREQRIAERELKLETRVKVLEEALINKSRNVVEENKRFLSEVSTPIGFTACVSVADLKNLGAGHTIVFDRVITNMGSGYHPNLGVFEAPLKGLYVFHATAMTRGHDSQYLALVRNGSGVSDIYPDSDGSSDYQSASGTWVLELDVNAEVYLQTVEPGEIHGNCFTTFSGFLLQELE